MYGQDDNNNNNNNNIDVVVIAGGLAGLNTAALVACAGKSVTLFERPSIEIGGRTGND
jgi:phytoene dehydrogenase-like protein